MWEPFIERGKSRVLRDGVVSVGVELTRKMFAW